MAQEYEEKLEDFYKNIYNDLERKTLGDDFGNYLYTRINTGTKKVYNKTQIEVRNFNMDFLNVIESAYPALLKIMRDPKRSIRYEQEIVVVEKAKRVNADTVKHLSSHTHLIKEVKKNGDVIPAKVLSTYAEEELAIYENRFIKSLVKRIEIFLERRYEVMSASLDSFEAEHLNIENDFLMSGKNVSVKIDINVKEITTKNVNATKADYERLIRVRELIQGLKGLEFMRVLAKAKDVFPPIMKTNILMHNPDFQMCYNLWVYLDRTDGIAFDVDVKEKNYRYTAMLDKDMNQAMTLMLAAFMRSRDIAGVSMAKQKTTIKAPKPTLNKEIVEEPTLKPDNQQIEDYRLNEYLLNKTAKFYEATLDGMQRSGYTEYESYKVVYRQMMQLMDQIYPKVFGIVEEEIDKSDLNKRLAYAQKRLTILRTIQKQKQMSIARVTKSINKCNRDVTSLERRIKINEAKNQKKESKPKKQLKKQADTIENSSENKDNEDQ